MSTSKQSLSKYAVPPRLTPQESEDRELNRIKALRKNGLATFEEEQREKEIRRQRVIREADADFETSRQKGG